MIKVKITFANKNIFQKAFKKLKENFTKPLPAVYVGLWNSVRYPDGTSVADVAFFNAFGTKKIPSRNFLEESILPCKKILLNFIPSIIHSLANDKDVYRWYRRIGVSGAAVMKNVILTHEWTPNAESTVVRKKSSRPLVDTGLLVRSVTFEIVGVKDPLQKVKEKYGIEVK